MTARLNKFVLTTHISFSVGWLGAVAVFLSLAITGITSRDTQLAHAAYLAMEVSGWFVIVPFCLASLFTGVVQALGTQWGLFKYYWVAVKLFLTIAATILLLLHLKPVSRLAGVTADTLFSDNRLPGLQIQLVADAGAALLVLLAITTISVYKPWGRIQYSLRKDQKRNSGAQMQTAVKRSWGFYVLLGLIGLALLLIIMHLLGGGMGGH